MNRRWVRVAAPCAAAITLAGCGSSSPHGTTAGRATVPAYGSFPQDTISVSSTNPTSPACRVDARAFARASRFFATQVPADTYYMVMREELADFTARRCDPALLGQALERGLTAQQRRSLIANLPRQMARVVRAGIAAAAP